MPSGEPSIRVSSSATIHASSGSTYHAQLVATSLRNYPTGASFFARLTPDERLVEISGVSYYPRLDFVSTPDFTEVDPPDDEFDVILGTTGFSIAGGDTVYMTTSIDATLGVVNTRLPACTLTQLFVSCTAAPGSAKTFIYTVMKNGVATDLTATISGTDTTASLLGQTITFSAGDYFAVRVVTSSGSATTHHSYSVKLTA